jgi:hypothetical protein
MEMINRCLEISEAKRAELEAHDRHAKRKEAIAARRDLREMSGEFGNRKERRKQAALVRHGKEIA